MLQIDYVANLRLKTDLSRVLRLKYVKTAEYTVWSD